jgi:hypothetical protein
MAIPSWVFDPLACTATAFRKDDTGAPLFTPFGQVGGIYRLETVEQSLKMEQQVGIQCLLAAILVITLFGVAVLYGYGVIETMMPWAGVIGGLMVVWVIVFFLWSMMSTRGLQRVDTNAH